VKKYDFASPGSKNPAWKGGRVVNANGYVKLWMPEHPNCDRHNYFWEHRYVMEQMLGRLLLRNEVVHHRNKKHGDNRPENLELFSSNGEHLKKELKGQRPKWGAEGYERIQIAVRKWRESRRKRNRLKSKRGARP
jgi:hypothetical protein